MKKYKNYLFITMVDTKCIKSDLSQGYLETCNGNMHVKLPHKTYELLGIVDECINSSYAEEFSAEIVEKDEFGGYLDYELEEHNYDLASDSFQTLERKLNLKPTDYILRDEK